MDFWTDPTHAQPVFAALMAGEFLLGRGEGDVYIEDEIRDMLAATGLGDDREAATDRSGEPCRGRVPVAPKPARSRRTDSSSRGAGQMGDLG